MTIPRRIIRVVPERTTAQVEGFWAHICDLHPGWEHLTLRDPLDPAQFPATAHVWAQAASGAQFAGLIRLEALRAFGGVYLDSDMELFRPLDPLLELGAFAGIEDGRVVPDAVLGAEPGHPAIDACLQLAVERIRSSSTDWVDGNGAWSTGPGVTTTVLPGRPDVTILPREAFYPIGYWEKELIAGFVPGPATYGMHWWEASWLR